MLIFYFARRNKNYNFQCPPLTYGIDPSISPPQHLAMLKCCLIVSNLRFDDKLLETLLELLDRVLAGRVPPVPAG